MFNFSIYEKEKKGYTFERVKKKFIKEDARFSTFYCKVSWIKSFGQLYLIFTVWLVAKGIVISNVTIALIFLAGILGLWLGGWVWDKTHMFHLTNEFSNERNYFVIEMRKLQEEVRDLKEKVLNNLKK